MIQQRVIQAYEEEKARSKLPGYVPSYEDFDDDSTWMPPAAGLRRRRTSEAPKVQAAEKPRGPHRPPAAPQRGPRPGETRGNDSFGAGIFE